MSPPCLTNATRIALPARSSASDSNEKRDGNLEFLPPSLTAAQSSFERTFVGFMLRCWNNVRKTLKVRQASIKHLRVCETAPLGDKRFVAVIQVDQERFLIGGAANSIAMLARLSEPASFPQGTAPEYGERSQER